MNKHSEYSDKTIKAFARQITPWIMEYINSDEGQKDLADYQNENKSKDVDNNAG